MARIIKNKKFLALAVFFIISLFYVFNNNSLISKKNVHELEKQTIEDFGNQWNDLTDNQGYYASNELFQDILGPNFKAAQLKDKIVIDIGAGSGRVTSMIYREGPAHIHSVEPAGKAFEVLKKNTEKFSNNITYHNATGDKFQVHDADYAVSLGVIHHIPDPLPSMQNIYDSLKPGGEFVMWIYGYEGNEVYLSIFQPIRKITTLMNDKILHIFSKFLTYLLSGYIYLCDYFPLPMQDYMLNHLKHFSWDDRYKTVFDQLNPAWAKYYKRSEAIELMEKVGFKEISIYHRHGYSWTVVGKKQAI